MAETSDIQCKDGESIVITDQERELAQNALQEFKKGSYGTCLNYLNKLETLRPKDLKVMHNKVIVEYYKSDLKKTELTRKSLNAVCGQMSTTDLGDAMDDVEKCVMRYNQAILLYHTGQYTAALQIANRLFAYIEPMEENLAHKVCLLLIELHIIMEQPDAALSLIHYVENQFISTENSKISAVDKEGIIKSAKEQKDQKKDNSDIDAFKIKLLKCKVRIYLLTHQSKLCKKEWKTLVSTSTPINASTICLKANLEYLKGNYKKAIKLLNSLKTENADFKSYGKFSAVLYYNNMACLHLAMSKPNLACFYLQKALQENKNAIEGMQVKDNDPLSSQPLYALGNNKHYELMYALGVSYLHAGQASKAFDCFTEAAQRLHNSPKLWLRMAECCIYCHKPSNEIDFNIPKRRKDLVQKVVGSGMHRKIVLTSSLSRDTKYHTEGLSYAIPQPTLEFALLCLKNALFLLPNNNELNLSISTITNPQTVSLTLAPGHNLNGQHSTSISQAMAIEALNLKISVLAASAYVSLCLGDYIVALEHAKALLNLNRIPGAYRMLANLYAAESLVLMDKINEAIEYLKPENIQDLNTFVPIPEIQEKDKVEEVMLKLVKAWYPTTVPTGMAVFRYNLAVAYAIRGELDKSGETLKQVWLSKGSDCDVPIHVIMLALYIELQLGHADVSRSIIKQHYPQYR